jgi:hypothetical protein
MVVTLDSKRRLSVPKNLVPARPGDVFEVVFDAEEDTIIFRRIRQEKSWLAVMQACPTPIDDLPARSREYFKSKL